MDVFTRERIKRFIREHRARTGQLPTLGDLDEHGFSEDLVKTALKKGLIERFYVTLTNGTVVKGFKLIEDDERP